MGGYSLMTLLLAGVRYVACSPTPIDDLTINLNLRKTPEDEGSIDYETFDEDQELKAGQTPGIFPVVIGGLTTDQENVFNLEKDEFYQSSSGRWEDMPKPMKKSNLRNSMGVATLSNNNKLYMAGGKGAKNKKPLKTVYMRYTGNWAALRSSLQTGRKSLTLTTVTIDNIETLVVTGGLNEDDQPLKSVEIYEQYNKTWVTSPNKMIQARGGHAAVLLNERLYALGGKTGGGKPSKTTEFSNTRDMDMAWTLGHLMNEERSFHGATVLGENIYICGGQKLAVDLESFDILKTCEYGNGQEPYTVMESMKHVRTSFAMLTVGEEIWAIGGIGGYISAKPYLVALDTVEKYDSVAGKWNEMQQKLQKPRCMFGATNFRLQLARRLESANRSMNNRTG